MQHVRKWEEHVEFIKFPLGPLYPTFSQIPLVKGMAPSLLTPDIGSLLGLATSQEQQLSIQNKLGMRLPCKNLFTTETMATTPQAVRLWPYIPLSLK